MVKMGINFDKTENLNNNIYYNYDIVTKIMYKVHYGLISAQQITDSWQWAFTNNIIPQNTKRYLLDYRQAEFINPVRISSEIVRFYHANLMYFKDCKFAIVSDKSKNIATSLTVKKSDYSYQSEPFSFIELAIEWLIT